MREELTVANADDMVALGRRLATVLLPGDLVVLSGDLGAGKTTLVQGIGAGLGVRGPITSPTFVIARVHPSLSGGPALVHADAYRLTSPAEVDDLDLDASLGTSVTVVEWGGGLVEGLAPDRLDVSIALATPAGSAAPGPERPGGAPGGAGPGNGPGLDQEPRTVRLEGHGARWAAASDLPPAGSAPASGGAPSSGSASASGGASASGSAPGSGRARAGGVPAGRTAGGQPSPGDRTAS
jgi:tRNA threonylcarbamoyladenosine biosynthesis protein TsaE